jgi:signal transduction histidine kinase
MRRFLGRAGWPVVFLLVAGLVFAGLGWVTHAALGVEQAQREAAARAELGNSLRVALWRLDGRMLPALGVEDSRPFYHYDCPDPAGPYGAVATPLIAAPLPEWMRLHFQLTPNGGWASNQAPADRAEGERALRAWPDLPRRNWYGGREEVLADLNRKFPAPVACETFAARERAIPDNSLPLAANLFTEVNPDPPEPPAQAPTPKPPPPTDPVPVKPTTAPDPGPDVFRVFGHELCARCPEAQAAQQQAGNTQNLRQDADDNNRRPGDGKANPAGNTGYGGRVLPRGGQREGPDRAEYPNRAQTVGKAMQDAVKANEQPLGNSVYQNTMAPADPRNRAAGPPDPSAKPAPPTGPGGPAVPTSAPPAAAGAAPQAPPAAPADGPGGGFGAAKDKAKEGKGDPPATPWREADRSPAALVEWLAELSKSADAERKLDAKKSAGPAEERRGRGADEKGRESEAKPAVPAAPPGEDRPSQPPPVAVHLGSMRPQWVTDPGGADVLVLVRAAKFDTKTVYQGVVLDWPKLRAALQDEVKDLFPDARLVPVKDPDGVSPDRAMTALPVQLDPGPDPVPPPAGWTPLRIGLLTAWAAAVLAVAAVGFSGWTLVDHAERRMRFVSAVTHELRTPLTSLRLYLDLLVSGMIQDEAKRQEYLTTLATESDRLHRLIDNVLDFARLEKRRKGGDVRLVKVSDLLDPLRATWADRVAQDGMELVVVSTLPADREVRTDPGMAAQIVGNLIDNARKYARDAADRRVWLWARPGTGSAVVLEVEDRGPGVPAGERKTVFKPFRRGAAADATSGGAGLGLALAKSWAEVVGAKLTYRPADGGVGACFRLELPGC